MTIFDPPQTEPTLQAGWPVTFALVSIVLLGLVVLYQSVAVVGGGQIAVLERRWFGRKMPEGRVVAMRDEVGIQARILGPGLHLLTPFIYAVQKMPMILFGKDEVGLVDAIDGRAVPPGRIFAAVVQGHNLFQDGEGFLRNHGERGPQIEILPPGLYRIKLTTN